MNANSKIWITGLLSLCLAACGDRTTPDDNEPSASVPIGFSSNIVSQDKEQTRGGVIDDISSVYLFASYTGKNSWGSTDIPNFMYHQEMTRSGNTSGGYTWTYSPLKYWPNATDEKISFFAYHAPTGTNGFTYSGNTVPGPAFTYTVPANESAQQDILAASCLNRTNSTDIVSFSMNHILTQVRFKIQNGDAKSEKVLSALNISMPGKGTMTFGADGDGKVSWSADTPANFTADTHIGGSSSKTITLADANKDDIVATFFLLPIGDPSSKVTLKLTYVLKKTSGTDTGTSVPITSAISLSATPVWNPGSNLIYTVSIIDDRLEIGNVTVADFGNGTSAGDELPAT